MCLHHRPASSRVNEHRELANVRAALQSESPYHDERSRTGNYGSAAISASSMACKDCLRPDHRQRRRKHSSVRYNGKCFDIHISSHFFVNSPAALDLYVKYLDVIDPQGPGDSEDFNEDDVCDWLTGLFLSILVQLAPEPLPAYDPEKIKSGESKPFLSDYLFPETVACRLDVVNESFVPSRTDDKRGPLPPRNCLDEETIAEWATWARVFEPSDLEVYLHNPEHALSKMPTTVRVNLAESGHETIFFYSQFEQSVRGDQLYKELDNYKIIAGAEFNKGVNHCRLIGVVHERDRGSTLSLLLQYIDHKGTLDDVTKDQPRLDVRRKWARQIKDVLGELHGVGAVWGDAKPKTVLIDKEDNAWLIGSEPVSTWPWVDEHERFTVEGDLQALERIVEFVIGGVRSGEEVGSLVEDGR